MTKDTKNLIKHSHKNVIKLESSDTDNDCPLKKHCEN